ncbi:MAG: bifunctional [glutamine synthetase] adenylyltransferase/[glutamine synthetase]-adenylyl-L-tyrosine phosphorylase [Acidimicrobiia bacterium]
MDLPSLIDHSADPPAVRTALERAGDTIAERLTADADLARAWVTTVAASRSAARVLEADPAGLAVLADLDAPASAAGADVSGPDAASDSAALARWRHLEHLRIMARDLLGLDEVEQTTAELAGAATAILRAAVRLAGADGLAVIGMGKLGGRELNYASDVDLMFVGGDPRDARAVVDIARRCFRVDMNLRPEGRNGALTRSVDSYAAYWERWARPWEFQALLKAVPVAGDDDVAREWSAAATAALWGRRFGTDDLRSVRRLKERAEDEVERAGTAERELKRSPGGIRDIEFAVQVLQLVHGRTDPQVRSPTTLVALDQLADGGYVAPPDAEGLVGAYRFLRRVEHALQIEDEQQTHTLPADRAQRRRIARVLGYRGTPRSGTTEALDRDLRRHRTRVRTIHESLYFRPLLDALAGVGRLSTETATDALASFGFADAERTRAAVRELTRGLTRSSRMMQQVLPLLLDWLSTSPAPDLGLLGLRKLASGEQRARELAGAFRDSPEVARRLCVLLGTSALLGDILAANPDLIVRLADPRRLQTQERQDLLVSARRAVGWRAGVGEQQAALRRWRHRHMLGIAARDVLEEASVERVGTDLTSLAEASVESALASLAPGLPVAVVALGRFAGGDLSYGSDLDVVFVHEGATEADHEEGLRLASGLMRFLAGVTPAQRIYEVDVGLRPEGRQGALSRTVEGYAAYFERWARTWERQAMARARPVAGDPDLGARFMAALDGAVWGRPFTADDEREVRRMKARVERERIPAGEDPEFHLKLGRGSLSDVEWTVQLLQLRTGTRSPSTTTALRALVEAGALDEADGEVLAESYRFCERTRNRWWLVGSGPQAADSLPRRADPLGHLARSLDTTPTELRDDYRRVTRRARRVVERIFYGQP